MCVNVCVCVCVCTSIINKIKKRNRGLNYDYITRCFDVTVVASAVDDDDDDDSKAEGAGRL